MFLCERCGWAHLCDDACKERIVDAATDMLVCPISGFCSGRVLTEDEVRHSHLDSVPGVQRPTVMHDHAFELEARCAPCAGGGAAAR